VAVIVLDASVIIAFFYPLDALHARAVAGIQPHRTDELVLPASAYSESLVGPTRLSAHVVASHDQLVADFAIRIVPITAEIARRAARLRADTASLRLPDALVLATADVLDAPVVLTGDARWLDVSDRVRVI
jgi:predicted nucleic acid-binding protein